MLRYQASRIQQEICALAPASSAATHDTRKANSAVATLGFEEGYESEHQSEDLENEEPFAETKEALCFLEIHPIVDIQGVVQVEAPTDALLANVATSTLPHSKPPTAMPLSIHPTPTDIRAQHSVVIPEHLKPPTTMPLSIHPTPTDIRATKSSMSNKHSTLPVRNAANASNRAKDSNTAMLPQEATTRVAMETTAIAEVAEVPLAQPQMLPQTIGTARWCSGAATVSRPYSLVAPSYKVFSHLSDRRQDWVPDSQQTHPLTHHVHVEPATPELISCENPMMPSITGWQASKRTKSKRGSKQTNNMYTCAYCGQIKTSFSGSADSCSRIRIRCECGGRYRDGKLRMHCSWNLANGQRVDNHNGKGWIFVDDKSKQQLQQVTVDAQIAKLQNLMHYEYAKLV